MGKTFNPSPSLGPGRSGVGEVGGLAEGVGASEVGCWEVETRRHWGVKELELCKRCCLVWVLFGVDFRLGWTNQRLTRGNVYEDKG